jgi:hypothetical protein
MLSRLPICISILLVFLTCSSEPEAKTTQSSDIQTFLSHDGQKIAYRDGGEGPAVILLHGFINDGSNWLNTELYRQLRTNGRHG